MMWNEIIIEHADEIIEGLLALGLVLVWFWNSSLETRIRKLEKK